MNRILGLIIVFFSLSCSSEKTQEKSFEKDNASKVLQSPTVDKGPYSVQISPADASRDTTLYLIPAGINLSDAKIQWLVNGNPIAGAVSYKLRAPEIKRGDTVQAKAIIKGMEILSNVVQIKNAPPEMSRVKILPEVFNPGDVLNIDAAGTDPDGDKVTILYEWTKNGEPAGKGKQIEAPLKREDKISIRVTPFDGEIYGGSITLNREIGNLPPMIIDNKDVSFEQDVFTYQVKATDPDGDSLAYSLKTAPSGMSIDAKGLIRWKVPPDFKGKASVAASVTDGHGGEATQNFVLEIKTEK